MLISAAEQSFSQYYQVVRNKIFNGGHITKYYSQIPSIETLQIEVRYQVYLQSTQLDNLQPPDWDVPQFQKAKLEFYDIFVNLINRLALN